MKSKAKARKDVKKPHVLGYLLSREETAKVSGGLKSAPSLETPGFYSNEQLGQDKNGA